MLVYDESGTVFVNFYVNWGLDKAGDLKRATFDALTEGDYYIRIARNGNLATKYKFSITAP